LSIGRLVESESDERLAESWVRHQYRALSDGEKMSIVHIKDMGIGLIRAIEAGVPRGREASLAKTKVEEAVLWAVKGVTDG